MADPRSAYQHGELVFKCDISQKIVRNSGLYISDRVLNKDIAAL